MIYLFNKALFEKAEFYVLKLMPSCALKSKLDLLILAKIKNSIAQWKLAYQSSENVYSKIFTASGRKVNVCSWRDCNR